MASSKADIERARRYRREKGAEIGARRSERRRERIARGGIEELRLISQRAHHGSRAPEDVARLLEQQGHRCYLCEKPFPSGKQAIDHDHGCCPPQYSCRACRRGIACHPCNILIALAADSPHLLRLIADNLERIGLAAKARIAAKSQQMELELADES